MSDIFRRNGFPHAYELILRLPVIRSIRAQEQRLLHRILTESLRPGDEVLEIGAGTGFYTFDIAQRCRSVIALEPSAGMARILKARITASGVRNISVIETDFFAYTPDKQSDVVAAIGVLDVISEWRTFLDRCLKFAKRRVIVTVPQRSFWSAIYLLFGKISRSPACTYKREELMDFLRGHPVEVYETGLRTRWTNGLTLVIVIEKESP